MPIHDKRPATFWRRWQRLPILTLFSLAGTAALAHCGGGATDVVGTAVPHDDAGAAGAGGSGAGVGGQSAGPGGSGGCGASTPVGRPAPVVCPMTQTFPQDDAGAISCTQDTECGDAGYSTRFCRGGTCVSDQCLTDADCATGSTCVCSNQFRGNALHTNLCLASQCRDDADCGLGGVCSAQTDSFGCGSVVSYGCRTPADTCGTDADCCGDPSTPSCRYDAELGHWTCHARVTCNG